MNDEGFKRAPPAAALGDMSEWVDDPNDRVRVVVRHRKDCAVFDGEVCNCWPTATLERADGRPTGGELDGEDNGDAW